MLEFFLVAGGVLACLIALPFLSGMLIAMLVTVTPGLKMKLWIAKLFARCFRRLGKDVYLDVLQEVTWTVYRRYGSKEVRALYKKMLG